MTNKRHEKIIIVEDNELNMKLFTDILLHCGFEIEAINDGNNVIGAIKKYKPHLILMDIQLGGISGLDLIKKIKNTSSMNHIPIIAITAFAMRHDEEKIMESGCESYLTKPIAINTLINEVEKYVLKTSLAP
ncbi:Polar-differentiation response regulator DivK [Candidatus Xenohaliotis californiensis]|uniref:Polar-differentiation response regulator DivK n=1 Tax=Candidatus Xenohaliotis californiensis TaxID=84677 RepID=A0ABP0EWA5_9RICK|nr:Polar-differentiation response regulator DivK [Candidatus Xenohaliotis californiensis]